MSSRIGLLPFPLFPAYGWGVEASPLQDYFSATDDATAQRALSHLLLSEAEPVLRRIIGQRFGIRIPSDPLVLRPVEHADAEETLAEARARLIGRLHELRSGATGPPIADFGAYVAQVAVSAWQRHLRRRNPARARFLERLQYLVAEAGAGFAAWNDAAGRQLAGFEAWREFPEAPLPVSGLPRPGEAARATGGELARCVAQLLDAAGGPVAFEALGRTLAEGVEPEATDPAARWHSTPAGSPAEATGWREELSGLWTSLQALPREQRVAFLLPSDVLQELVLTGIANLRTLAALLGLTPEDLAAAWDTLPWDDDRIADFLGLKQRQQIINLRRAARTALARALALHLTPS